MSIKIQMHLSLSVEFDRKLKDVFLLNCTECSLNAVFCTAKIKTVIAYTNRREVFHVQPKKRLL